MSNIQAKQADFMSAGEQRLHSLNEIMRMKHLPEQARLYINLIEEEHAEFEKSVQYLYDANRPDEKLAAIADIADDIADLVVVLMGLCNTLGIPFNDIYNEVHKSNMLKCAKLEDGSYRILKRADGKIIKPSDWRKPDIISILKYRLINGD